MKKKMLAKVLGGSVVLPLASLAMSGAASASDIRVTGTLSWSGNTTNWLTISLDSGATTSTVKAGEPALTVTEVTGSVLPTGLSGVPDSGDFSDYVWCIDPVQYAASNTPYIWDLVALEDAPDPGPVMGDNADDMRLLFGNVYTTDLGGIAPITGVASGSINFDAFQLAIWEISKETSDTYSLSDGVFQATASAAVIAEATTWLTALNALNDGDNTTVSTFDSAAIANNLFALSEDYGNGYVQDYIVAIDITDDSPNPVPLPAAAWLFGSALIGTVAVGRRRKAG